MEADSVGAFAADTVKVCAAAGVSAIEQEFEGSRDWEQFELSVEAVATKTRPAAALDPRFRTMMLGALSAEMLRLGAEAEVDTRFNRPAVRKH